MSFGPGVVEDGFLFEFNGSFVAEFGFTPELLEGVLPLVMERATARLHEKLTHGPVAI